MDRRRKDGKESQIEGIGWKQTEKEKEVKTTRGKGGKRKVESGCNH